MCNRWQPAQHSGVSLHKLLDLTAIAVKIVGWVFALLLVGNILLTVFGATVDNPITRFFVAASHGLTLWFEGLFTPGDPMLAMGVNYSLAAVFWLVAAAIVARLIRAVH